MSSRSSSLSSEGRGGVRYRSYSRSRSRSPDQNAVKHKKHKRKHKRKHHKEEQYEEIVGYVEKTRTSLVHNSDDDSNGGAHHRPHKVKREVYSDEEQVTVKQEPTQGRVRVKKERWDNGDFAVKQEKRDKRRDRPRRDNERQRDDRRDNDRRREDNRRRNPLPTSAEAEDEEAPVDKDKPNFELSGKLTEETNTFRGVVIKYSEPPEARKPRKRWRFYPFKGDQSLPVLHVSRQSAYLLGRDRKIADMPIDHPSCSKQHAVLQYRLVEYARDDGTFGRQVRPYIIDLESANGTYVNNKRIDTKRYVELQEKDVVKFGFSTREYVLLHDKTNTEEVNSDEGESE